MQGLSQCFEHNDLVFIELRDDSGCAVTHMFGLAVKSGRRGFVTQLKDIVLSFVVVVVFF